MESNHQLFSHDLRSCMKMQQSMAERNHKKSLRTYESLRYESGYWETPQIHCELFQVPTADAEPEVPLPGSKRSEGNDGKGSAL